MGCIRLGVIGCGGMEGVHEEAYKLLAERMRVTATADIVGERAERAAKVLGADHAVTDFRDMLDHVDAVMIVLPHALHHSVGLACLETGKHVLMEKPLAVNERECLELIRAADDARRVLMVAYCMRFHPLVVRLKELTDRKTYGDVFQVSIWTEQHTEPPPGSWHTTGEGLGGGQFFSHGCHYIDLLLWFLGSPVRGTHFGTNYGTPWMEQEGTSNVTIRFAGGALGYHFGTWGARGTRLGYSIHAHGTEGMLEADIYAGTLTAYVHGKKKVLFNTTRGKHTHNEMAHFLDCIERGLQPLTDGPGSLQGLRVIWRLYEAERQGATADLRGLGLDEPWGN